MRSCSGWGLKQRIIGQVGLFAVVLVVVSGCDSTMPSERLNRSVHLPTPTVPSSRPLEWRMSQDRADEVYEISAESMIPLAFSLQPNIKSSFQRFKSEEARYDFFVVSRDSLTPRFRSTQRVSARRDPETTVRDRSHTVELGIEKRFFDTTELDVNMGYVTSASDEEIGNSPFVSARLRYPLWASREKLERTSEDIFQRNFVNDSQLSYINEVRQRLQRALFQLHRLLDFGRQVSYAESWLEDLGQVLVRLEGVQKALIETDRSRIRAEITRVNSIVRNLTGRYEVELGRLKVAVGLPLFAQVEPLNDAFNPFEGKTHEELYRLSIATDPEISTLQNEVENAEVQLDLARRGQWDIALLLDGRSSLEGRGETNGESDWSMTVGFNVSRVDARVTTSLTRQAQTRIQRFEEAIAARENIIFMDILEQLIRIDTLGASRVELEANLHRFHRDYDTGLENYLAGKLNVDDLLRRRESLRTQQNEVSRLVLLVGLNVAELCTATGKYFEILDDSGVAGAGGAGAVGAVGGGAVGAGGGVADETAGGQAGVAGE